MALEAEKATLIERIDSVRDRIQEIIAGADMDSVIHPTSGWRLRDILAHIAAWQREAVAAGRAHVAGEGDIPFKDIAWFNQVAYERWRQLSDAEVVDAWCAVYDDLKEVVRGAPAETWEDEFVFSWGERGTLARLVRSILSHDAEHVAEIRAALGK